MTLINNLGLFTRMKRYERMKKLTRADIIEDRK